MRKKSMDAKLNIKIVAALTLVHFTGDFYTSFTSPLLPVYVDKLSLSMTQVGKDAAPLVIRKGPTRLTIKKESAKEKTNAARRILLLCRYGYKIHGKYFIDERFRLIPNIAS